METCGQIDIGARGFDRDLYAFIRDPLLASGGGRFLELGCYPGKFMRLFAEHGGYEVSGLEYVESCVEPTEKLLRQVGVESTVSHGDFRTWHSAEQWDLVASFGLIEHFDETRDVLEHHARFARDGGCVLVTFPLHCGIYGRIMAWAAPDRLAQHNRMSLEDAVAAAKASSCLTVVKAGYLGRFGFGATRLRRKIDRLFSGSRLALGLPLRITERIGRMVAPNTRTLSPYAAMIARVNHTGRCHADGLASEGSTCVQSGRFAATSSGPK
ncbi:MAG: class I SAM-dependent methyltransferase [Phycisphaerales bacterium]|nr:class I SAM-dependent methyltransferase [Phycisphaerales bacterium]